MKPEHIRMFINMHKQIISATTLLVERGHIEQAVAGLEQLKESLDEFSRLLRTPEPTKPN